MCVPGGQARDEGRSGAAVSRGGAYRRPMVIAGKSGAIGRPVVVCFSAWTTSLLLRARAGAERPAAGVKAARAAARSGRDIVRHSRTFPDKRISCSCRLSPSALSEMEYAPVTCRHLARRARRRPDGPEEESKGGGDSVRASAVRACLRCC